MKTPKTDITDERHKVYILILNDTVLARGSIAACTNTRDVHRNLHGRQSHEYRIHKA
jgi:hypothetical protein